MPSLQVLPRAHGLRCSRVSIATPLIPTGTTSYSYSFTNSGQKDPRAITTASMATTTTATTSKCDGLSVEQIKAANREMKAMIKNTVNGSADGVKPVAVFVGATSGLGLMAMRKWVELIDDVGGRVYFVGRYVYLLFFFSHFPRPKPFR